MRARTDTEHWTVKLIVHALLSVYTQVMRTGGDRTQSYPTITHTFLFPGPTDVTEAQLQALARHYLDPSTGLYNYLRFS